MPGQRVGPYRLLGRLGGGAMGEVHRAEHERTGQVVALKTVSLPREAHLVSLRREILALSRIRHPGIVRIVDHGQAEGLPWYAMEVIEGRPLSALGIVEALRVLRLACAPLAYLHGEGIVHRDLKPENVLVRADGFPVLVDFGLTTRFTAERGRDQLEMATGAAGTLSYAAPELLRGEPVDARADLYALGCMLHQTMTGSLPFTGSFPEVVRGHLERPPEAPARAITVPLEIEVLIVRLLAKDPRQRVAHADDVADILARVAPDARWPALPRASAFLYRPGFAGRRGLLDAVAAELAGSGACLVGGESGLGKTRLAIELARAAEAVGVRVLTGECTGVPGSRSGVPLEALRRPLLAIADRCREHGREETERVLGPRARSLATIEPGLYALPGLPREDDGVPVRPQRLFDDLLATLAALAEDAPVLLVLDDLHRADELTLAFLAHALRALPPGVKLLGLYRSDEAPAALSALTVARRQVARLDPAAVVEMAGDMLALPDLPARLGAHLVQKSEGNPLFVAEYLRAAVTQGRLLREGGRWVLAEGALSPALPGSLRELIEGRLDALSSGAGAVAEVAAVLGREVDAELLSALAPELDLDSALVELIAREVLVDADGLAFAHDTLREVAYQRSAAEPRRRLHLAAGGLLAAREARADWGKAALHLALGGDLEAATRAYVRAGNDADQAGSLPEALEYFTQALPLARQLGPELAVLRLRAMVSRGRFLADAGRLTEAIVEEREAAALAAELGDVRLEIKANIELSYVTWMAEADGAKSLAHAERAAQLAVELGDARVNAMVENALGIACTACTFRERAAGHYDRARILAEAVGDLGLASKAVTNLGAELGQIGRYDESRIWLERSLELKRAAGHQSLLGSTWVNLGLAHLGLGDPQRALEAFRLGIDSATRASRRNVVEDGTLGLGEAALAMASLAQARAAGEWVLSGSERRVARGGALRLLGKVAAAQGRMAEAAQLFPAGLAICRAVGERDELADTLLAYGRFLRDQQDPVGHDMIVEARAIYRELGFAGRLASALAD